MAFFQVFIIFPGIRAGHNNKLTRGAKDNHHMNCLLSIIYASSVHLCTLAFLVCVQLSF